jgi:hypothetical protein
VANGISKITVSEPVWNGTFFCRTFCGKLFLAIVCMVADCFYFVLGVNRRECILVMWGLKSNHFVFYKTVRKEVYCCIGSGWFSEYVNLKASWFACYQQIEKVCVFLVFICAIGFHVFM